MPSSFPVVPLPVPGLSPILTLNHHDVMTSPKDELLVDVYECFAKVVNHWIFIWRIVDQLEGRHRLLILLWRALFAGRGDAQPPVPQDLIEAVGNAFFLHRFQEVFVPRIVLGERSKLFVAESKSSFHFTELHALEATCRVEC